MTSAHEFFSMGGYAIYVWPAYAVTFVVMIGIAWGAVRGLKRARERALRQPEDRR